VVFCTAALFVFFQMVLQTFPSVMREGLVVDLSLNEAGFGGLSSSFYYPYILLQVPAGILVSRFGARAVLITAAVICTAASFLFAISQTAGYAEATRILMGLGAAPTVVCAMTLAAQWFPARLFPLLAALTEMAGMVGAAVGQEVLGFVVDRSGWRTGMLLCGATAAVLLVLAVLFIRNRDAGGTREHWPQAAEMKRLLSSPAILSSSVAGGLVGSAGMSFGMLWGVSFFQVHHHLSLTAASLCVSFYFWGALPGMLGSAWLCSRYRNAAQLLAIGAAGTAVTLILILFVLHVQVVQSVAMFVLGVFNSTYALAFTMVKDETPEHLSGVAMGLTNMTIMGIAAMLFQPLIGLLAHARGEDVPGAATLSAIIVAQVIALAILARGRTRRHQRSQPHQV
jgi:MFS family permease